MATICKCGGVRRDGECNRCGKAKVVEHRPSAHKRGYDYQWAKLSKAVRSEEPLCNDCIDQGRTTPSEHVHHKKKLSDYPELKMVRENLMALCKACHDIRTQRGE